MWVKLLNNMVASMCVVYLLCVFIESKYVSYVNGEIGFR